MDKQGRQTISCDVESCKYNLCSECACSLSEILVKPKQGCCSKNPDESMCASYQCKDCE